MTYGSTYERFYGRYHELTAGEAEILKYKKFSELKMTAYLNATAMSYLSNWIALKDDDFFVNLVISVVRNIYTYLRNLKPKVSRYREFHYRPERHEIVNPGRFDLIEKSVKMESNKTLFNSKYNEVMREYNSQLGKRTTSNVLQKSGSSIGITPFEIKQQLMKGNSNLLGKLYTDSASSTYMSTFKGTLPRFESKPIVFDLAQSCSTGVVVPDPFVYKTFRQSGATMRTLGHSQSAKILQ